MTLREKIENASAEEVLKLYWESIELEKHCYLPEDSILRRFSMEYHGCDRLFMLDRVSVEVYKSLAAFAVEMMSKELSK